GPYPLPNELLNVPVIKYISSFRSPNACQQIGACYAEGEFIHAACDDALYVNSGLDLCLDLLRRTNKEVITAKYIESIDGRVQSNEYFTLNHHNATKTLISKDDWKMFNVSFIKKCQFEKIGGFDCNFRTTCMGHNDLSLRFQYNNGRADLIDVPILICATEPGTSGSHAPTHYSQTLYDEPLYKRKWNSGILPLIKIDMNNWKNTPNIYSRRFCEEKEMSNV
ncbi:MAG: hypothetical protein AABY22_26855, partial [Nanoarchaeota archaeon]